uniref:Uncharacterized protein n=1 Tax=Rhizophora mucronata TaxID=61149 RepID=A0A2P2NED0_RHIMU
MEHWEKDRVFDCFKIKNVF